MKNRLAALCAAAVFASACVAQAAIVFSGPTSYTPRVDCTRPDGGYTEVTAFGWTPGNEVMGSPLWNSITTQTNGEFPLQWGYTFSNALNGNLVIDNYDVFDTDTGTDCKHGVTMKATLTGVNNLPAGQKLNWFQVYRENGDSISRGHAANDWTIDPSQREDVGGTEEDDAPFYYNQGEEGILHPNATTWKYSDTPSDVLSDLVPHHGGSIEFYTFLASWDGNYEPTEGGIGSHEITIYGGWSWGYSYFCPEPGSVTLLLAAAGTALRRKRDAYAAQTLA